MEGIQSYIEQYGEYLEDIRKRVYRTVIVFGAVFVLGFFSTGPLLKTFVTVLHIQNATIVTTSPFQLIDLAMSIGMFCAIVVTLPYVVHQIYGFLRPGLFPKERRIFLSLLPVGLLLFAIGFSYGFAVMYYALAIIASVNVGLGVVNLWDIDQFVSQIMITSALLGVLFEIPLILSFLIRLNLLSVKFLRDKRPHATVTILILVALLPPTDGLSFVIMSVPLLVIYELVIVLNSFGKKPRNIEVGK
jgi:sec-independent protein translocase protein TatC